MVVRDIGNDPQSFNGFVTAVSEQARGRRRWMGAGAEGRRHDPQGRPLGPPFFLLFEKFEWTADFDVLSR